MFIPHNGIRLYFFDTDWFQIFFQELIMLTDFFFIKALGFTATEVYWMKNSSVDFVIRWEELY